MDNNELVKKMKQGEIGFMDDPEEEKEVWEAFQSSTGKDIEQRKQELQEIARETLEKSKLISIPLSERDFSELKTKAFETGIPYQTLVSILIHYYVTDRISLTI